MSAKRTGRPVGERVKQACEIVEACGPCDYKLVSAWMEPGVLHNTHKYCNRAVTLGLMTVVVSGPMDHINAQFSIAPTWRAVLEQLAHQPLVRVPAVKRAPSQVERRGPGRPRKEPQSRWHGVSSVWGMAA